MKFSIGDRVVCTGVTFYGKKVNGFHGTVRTFEGRDGKLFPDEGEDTLIGVEWDEPVPGGDGHTLDRRCKCKKGHGWYVEELNLEFEVLFIEDNDADLIVDDIV